MQQPRGVSKQQLCRAPVRLGSGQLPPPPRLPKLVRRNPARRAFARPAQRLSRLAVKFRHCVQRCQRLAGRLPLTTHPNATALSARRWRSSSVPCRRRAPSWVWTWPDRAGHPIAGEEANTRRASSEDEICVWLPDRSDSTRGRRAHPARQKIAPFSSEP